MAKTQNVVATKSSLTDLFLFPVEKNVVVTSEYHLLVIACGAYRLATTVPGKNYSLESFPISEIKDVDFQLADKIKEYFSKKLAWLKLQGKKLTKFRSDLAAFLYTEFSDETGRYSTPDSFAGMAYRLPYFYHYDIEVDEMFGTDKFDFLPFNGTKVLNFIKCLRRVSRRMVYVDYFFSDENNFKYCIPLSKDNPCLDLYETVISKYPITVSGYFKPVRHDHVYYIPEKYIMDVNTL